MLREGAHVKNAIGLLGMLIFSSGLHALDTIEVYEPGLSDFEAYRTHGRNDFKNEFLVGYGYGQFINPTLLVAHEGEIEGDTFTNLRVSNISTFGDGALTFDLIPGVQYTSEGSALRPTIEAELSWIWGHWEPYTYLETTDWVAEDKIQAKAQSVVGVKYAIYDGAEIFVAAKREFATSGGLVRLSALTLWRPRVTKLKSL